MNPVSYAVSHYNIAEDKVYFLLTRKNANGDMRHHEMCHTSGSEEIRSFMSAVGSTIAIDSKTVNVCVDWEAKPIKYYKAFAIDQFPPKEHEFSQTFLFTNGLLDEQPNAGSVPTAKTDFDSDTAFPVPDVEFDNNSDYKPLRKMSGVMCPQCGKEMGQGDLEFCEQQHAVNSNKYVVDEQNIYLCFNCLYGYKKSNWDKNWLEQLK